jgi:hypothetical protein
MVDKASLGGVSDRRDDASRSAWASAGRWLFALLCVVVASLAGSASGRVSPAQIGAAQDTSPSVDAQRDAGRNLLRPHAEIATKGPTWRSVDPNGPQSDPHSADALSPPQAAVWFSGSDVGPVSCPDCEPHGLAIRDGYSRAPPTAIGRSRTFA